MSRQFIDDDLITWEVHASTGQFSLPENGRLVFFCVTDPERRPKSIPMDGDLVASQAAVGSLADEELRQLLAASRNLS